jgi:predicted RNase H-like HicB family nuclease
VERSSVAGARYLEDLPYNIILTREKLNGADGCWVALVEELPGCEARADTAEAATEALREGMTQWLRSAVEEGRAIPRPRNRLARASGKLAVEVPQSLHEALSHAALREGMSLNTFVTIALAGVIRWRPGNEVPDGRWIQARANDMMGASAGPRANLRRAIIWNAALLGLAVAAALALIVVAVARGGL